MKIYTSYFSNAKRLAADNIEIIGIALFPPKWFSGVSLKMAAPTYSIFKYSNCQEEYVDRYKKEVLSLMNPKKFLELINFHSRGRDVALCCFEKPDEFCHRHLLSEWLNSTLNLDVREYGIQENTPKEPDAKEQCLF